MKKVAATRGQKLIEEFRRATEGVGISGAINGFNCYGCLLCCSAVVCIPSVCGRTLRASAAGARVPDFRGTLAKHTATAPARKRFRQPAEPRPERATRNRRIAVRKRTRAIAMVIAVLCGSYQ